MGKSVYLVSEIERLLAQKKKVYSTIELKIKNPNYTYISPEKIMQTLQTLREGEIIMDEIQAYLNSRKWDTLALETQVFLQQHRKRGLNITGACQSIKRADVVFRELVQYFYDIRKIFVINFFGYPLGLFLIREFDADSLESNTRNYEQIGWGKLRFLDSKTFALYDTTQEYQIKTTKDLDHIEKKCKSCGYTKTEHK